MIVRFFLYISVLNTISTNTEQFTRMIAEKMQRKSVSDIMSPAS